MSKRTPTPPTPAKQAHNVKNPDGVPRLALRPAECARALGIGERKLWEITADKNSGIPVIKLGRAVVYPVASLETWLADQAQNKGRPGCWP